MSLAVNKHGHILKEFIPLKSYSELTDMSGIGGGHALIFHEKKLLLCHNKYRNNYELPGGGKEQGEDIQKCVMREIYEETGQTVNDLCIKGVTRTFIPRMNRDILWAVFCGEVDEISSFFENDEMNNIILWDMAADIDIDEVELKIIQIIMNLNSFV